MVHAFLQSCFGSSLVLNMGGIFEKPPLVFSPPEVECRGIGQDVWIQMHFLALLNLLQTWKSPQRREVVCLMFFVFGRFRTFTNFDIWLFGFDLFAFVSPVSISELLKSFQVNIWMIMDEKHVSPTAPSTHFWNIVSPPTLTFCFLRLHPKPRPSARANANDCLWLFDHHFWKDGQTQSSLAQSYLPRVVKSCEMFHGQMNWNGNHGQNQGVCAHVLVFRQMVLWCLLGCTEPV